MQNITLKHYFIFLTLTTEIRARGVTFSHPIRGWHTWEDQDTLCHQGNTPNPSNVNNSNTLLKGNSFCGTFSYPDWSKYSIISFYRFLSSLCILFMKKPAWIKITNIQRPWIYKIICNFTSYYSCYSVTLITV